MSNSNQESTNWPSAGVAIALVTLVGAVAITAIVRYDVDDALKIWSSLGTVVGVLTGGVVTYFFTRESVVTANKSAANAKDTADKALGQAENWKAALLTTAGLMDKNEWKSLESHPVIARALTSR